MLACLDAAGWKRFRRRAPSEAQFVDHARALKDQVCRKDPYERSGLRAVLNFGHTFGHVIESLTNFRVSHGDAVAMGILCALDVGRVLEVTPSSLADEVEGTFRDELNAPGRAQLAKALGTSPAAAIAELLLADKKARARMLKMVLLERLGRARLFTVPAATWQRLLPAWRTGNGLG
jgi:3-dehydroquinate synthase